MTNIIARNHKVNEFLTTIYSEALDENKIIDESMYSKSLEKLFSTDAWGFREILLVALVGMHLDNSFKPSAALYDCNPRAIYEGPIKDFLIIKKIPHRKSGPLNVAKATKGLNSVWASQRRPAEVAIEVVNIISILENNSNLINNVCISLFRRLIKESKNIEAMTFELEPSFDPNFLFEACARLINEAPDSGNTPQKIVALLLSNFHKGINDNIIVTGSEDRASVTSTTSKKPGDVNEESINGHIYKVYEITVKPFDIPRIIDSYDCISKYNEFSVEKINEIIVICRPSDCPIEMQKTNRVQYLGYYKYNDIIYYYVDIYEWISSKLLESTKDARNNFYIALNDYINDINTSRAVKKLWLELNSKG